MTDALPHGGVLVGRRLAADEAAALTGLSGAGKSTVGAKLGPALAERGHRVELLDGDEVRTALGQGRGGELPHFTGVSDPYEPPLQPELVLHTDTQSVDDSVHQVLTWLETNRLTPRW
jgi:adenylylsulfate kinase-like enzyme